MMLAVPDVPPYVTQHPSETSYIGEPDNSSEAGYWQERRDERAAAALKSHEAAAAILANYRLTGAPFVLLLRSFDVEGWTDVTAPAFEAETGLPAHVVSFAAVAASSIEQRLCDAVEGHGAVLGVANRDALFQSAWVVPRLFMPDTGWQETVEGLIRAAQVIVFHIGELTAGVRWELSCIQACRRMSSTLVVLQDTDDEVMTRGVLAGLRRFASIEREAPEMANEQAVELAGFDRVIRESAIPAAGLLATPLASDLFAEMQVLYGLDAEARVKRLAGL